MTLVHNNYHPPRHCQQQQEQHKAILAVDDERDIIIVMEHSSQIIGFRVYGFTDPLSALEHFRANCDDYFLVISDLSMPSMNGFDFIRKSKLISPGISRSQLLSQPFRTTWFQRHDESELI